MSERIAVLTGAGSGLGRAVALALGAADWRLVLAGRRLAPLQATADALRQGSREAECVVTDVTDTHSVERLFSGVAKRYGRLDLLFNNAGIFTPALPIDEITDEDWIASVDTNLTGVFLCTRAAFRLMKVQDPRGGRIINNGSIAATAPRPNSAPYSATKSAISGLTRSTALDGRPHNIACGQIDIGNAETEMTRAFAQGARQADGSFKPEPVMDARHAADAVAYMASLPLDANVLFMTVMATTMPFVGRG